MGPSCSWQESAATDFFAHVRLISASGRDTLAGMPPKPASRHVVAVLAMDGVHPFELSVPCEVFGIDRPEVVFPWPYEVIVTSIHDHSSVPTHNGFSIDTPYGIDDLRRADTIVVPAWPNVDQPPTTELVTALRAAHERGARVMSFCSGAFVLGYAGLLDGRRAATHWMYADALAARFPAVAVDRNVLYVDE